MKNYRACKEFIFDTSSIICSRGLLGGEKIFYPGQYFLSLKCCLLSENYFYLRHFRESRSSSGSTPSGRPSETL